MMVRSGVAMTAGSVKMVMPRCRSMASVSRKASPWSTRPSLRTWPVAYSSASDNVVLPASTCARMPATIRFMVSPIFASQWLAVQWTGKPPHRMKRREGLMVTPAGLEPATLRLEVTCSIQLSYRAKLNTV